MEATIHRTYVTYDQAKTVRDARSHVRYQMRCIYGDVEIVRARRVDPMDVTKGFTVEFKEGQS